MAADRIRALTAPHPIKPTSTRCLSAWRPNPGRRSTYRRGKSVQTTGTTSVLDVLEVEARLPDVVDHMIDERLLGRIDHDDPCRCRDEPGIYVAGTNMPQVVEHLERRDLVLQL